MLRQIIAASLAIVAMPALAQEATTKLLIAKINQQEPPPAIAAISQIKTGKVLNVWSTYARAIGCAGALPEHFLTVRLKAKGLQLVGVNAGMILTSFA